MTVAKLRTLPVVPVAPMAPMAPMAPIDTEGEACALQTPVAIDEDVRIDLGEALERAKLPPGRGRLAVVAMSGGVDSGVTALLMKEAGYRTIGINMRLFTPEEGHSRCCSIDDMEDARAVCQQIGIPFYPLNMEPEFVGSVIEPFMDAYLAGRTPNPCLECNRHVKFRHLVERAKMIGADCLATGHYARVVPGDVALGEPHRLFRAVDPRKDQSYVLARDVVGRERAGERGQCSRGSCLGGPRPGLRAR